jgi:KaiC/GvpD/RAD55 family RecA-like ATPase
MAELIIRKMSEYVSEPIEWLWEPYIPSGTITLIQGDGGEGKTTISAAIAAAVTLGVGLPGKGIAIPRSNVVMQNTEDSYTKKIRPQLERFGADLDRIHVIDADEHELSFMDERIEDTIILTDARVVILDPIQSFFGGKNMNSTGDVRPIMKHLHKMAERHNCTILLVGHFRKQGGASQYRGLGSIDIFNAARSVLTVGHTQEGEFIRAMVHNKSNLAPHGASQSFDFTDGFTWRGECDVTIEELMGKKKRGSSSGNQSNAQSADQSESQSDKARRLIQTALADGPVLSDDMEQMADDEGISYKTFKRVKGELGVTSVKRGDQWYWIYPIEVAYEVCP